MQTEQALQSGKFNFIMPRKALNKAFLKGKPSRSQIKQFKQNLIQLLDRTNDTKSEEFHKNLVTDFLKKTYYEPNHFSIPERVEYDYKLENKKREKEGFEPATLALKDDLEWQKSYEENKNKYTTESNLQMQKSTGLFTGFMV